MDVGRNASSASDIEVLSEDKTISLSPIHFGVSYAFIAVRLLTESDKSDGRWCGLCDKILLPLWLHVWRVHSEVAKEEKCETILKLQNAENEIKELQKRRCEDAKANEKVAGIFASQQQNWLKERKMLRLQLGALMKEMRAMEKHQSETTSKLQKKLMEVEESVRSKDKELEEEEWKKKELEEKLAKAETEVQKFREISKKESQEHSFELLKQKTAFIEIVSNQRRLESEFSRAVRLIEDKTQELEFALEQKKDSVLLAQKLSAEIMKMQNEVELKDEILSVVLRRSKLDTSEFKASKSKRKQAEMEIQKVKTVSESTRQHEKRSLRKMFASNINKMRLQVSGPVLKYNQNAQDEDPDVVPDVIHSHSTGEINELGEYRRLSDINRSSKLSTKVRITKKEPKETLKSRPKEAYQEKDAKEEQGKKLVCDDNANINLMVQSPAKEYVEIDSTELPIMTQPLIKVHNSTWRMDLQALGVSYKIKRLKQLLIMLERFAGKQEDKEIGESKDNGKKVSISFICLLNKQIDRYNSLQQKSDDLCKRMKDVSNGDEAIKDVKAKGSSKTTLEQFLEETFQLQRQVVATGQKLIEIQSKITSVFEGVLEDLNNGSSDIGFDVKRFAENMRTMFGEVQRGLEVRIARIIGGVEGTLACEEMVHMERR